MHIEHNSTGKNFMAERKNVFWSLKLEWEELSICEQGTRTQISWRPRRPWPPVPFTLAVVPRENLTFSRPKVPCPFSPMAAVSVCVHIKSNTCIRTYITTRTHSAVGWMLITRNWNGRPAVHAVHRHCNCVLEVYTRAGCTCNDHLRTIASSCNTRTYAWLSMMGTS